MKQEKAAALNVRRAAVSFVAEPALRAVVCQQTFMQVSARYAPENVRLPLRQTESHSQ